MALPEGSLERVTEVALGRETDRSELKALLVAVDVMNVTVLKVGVDSLYMDHLLRCLSEPNDRGWIFPKMRSISMFIHKVTPGALGRMIAARHDTVGAETRSLQMPITTMKVNGALKLLHAGDRIVVQSFIDLSTAGCRWE